MLNAHKSARASDIEPILRARLGDYLAGASTLNEFSDWFFSVSWDYQPKPGDLLGGVELILSEHTSGFGNEAEVKQMLGELATAAAGRPSS